MIIDMTPTWAGIVPALLLAHREGSAEGVIAAADELTRLGQGMDAIIADLPGLAEALGKLEKQLPRDVKNFPQWDVVQGFVDKYGKKEPAQ